MVQKLAEDPIEWIESSTVIQVSRREKQFDHTLSPPHNWLAAAKTCATVTCCMHW
jgi:hypothetical protein